MKTVLKINEIMRIQMQAISLSNVIQVIITEDTISI